MNSKNKGSSFERKICKELSLWITNNNRNDILWRSINSGAFATSRNKAGLTTEGQEGDIQSIDPLGQDFIDKFTIELKHYKDIQLINIYKDTSIISKWWYKLIKQTQLLKHPLLIIKQNNYPVLIATNKEIYDILNPNIYFYNDEFYLYEFSYLIEYNYDEFMSMIA